MTDSFSDIFEIEYVNYNDANPNPPVVGSQGKVWIMVGAVRDAVVQQVTIVARPTDGSSADEPIAVFYTDPSIPGGYIAPGFSIWIGAYWTPLRATTYTGEITLGCLYPDPPYIVPLTSTLDTVTVVTPEAWWPRYLEDIRRAVKSQLSKVDTAHGA